MYILPINIITQIDFNPKWVYELGPELNII
jgi:hypothetical protein